MLVDIEDGVSSHNAHFLQSIDMEDFLHLYVCVWGEGEKTKYFLSLIYCPLM